LVIKEICIDIETYGILKGVNQTCFHPQKSVVIDHIAPSDLIVTVALAYRNEEKDSFTCGVFLWNNKLHRQTLRDWFVYCLKNRVTILGQNILFDLSYLRYCDVEIKHLTGFSPSRNLSPIQLDDTMILNFLEFEERPEKSLKPLSSLMGLGGYENERVTGAKGTAESAEDPQLHHYNCLDCVRTLQIKDLLLQRIQDRDATSSKLSEVCRQHRNALIHIGLAMTESGITVSPHKLLSIQDSHQEIISSLMKVSKEDYGIILSGKGSRKSLTEVIENSLRDNNLYNDERVERTPKTRAISLNKANLRLLLTELDPSTEGYKQCRLIHDYKMNSHIINNYTRPLLHNPSKGILSSCCPRLYPSWHLVPSGYGKKSTTVRGTIQGRITCTRPGFQTFPSEIKNILRTRFFGGVLKTADYSQLELRVAALLSRDEAMINDYRHNKDLHASTAHIILSTLGVDIPDSDPSFHKIWRQAGKTLNFLVLFKGGPTTFLTTLREEAGEYGNIELLKTLEDRFDIGVCRRIISRFDARHQTLRRWQESLKLEALRTGRIELVTGWSRSFPGGSRVVNAQINEICNFPIQCLAAQIMQSGQYYLLELMEKNMLKTRMCAQTYDSVLLDCPPEEVGIVDKFLEEALTHPPILSKINGDLSLVDLKISIEDHGGYFTK